MPSCTIHLTENEVRMALRFWVDNHCPKVNDRGVHLTINAASLDPREPSVPTVTASIDKEMT